MDEYTASLLRGAAPDVVTAVKRAAVDSGRRGHFFFTDAELLGALSATDGPARSHLVGAGINPRTVRDYYERLYQPRTFPPSTRLAQPNGDAADWLEDARTVATRDGAAAFDGRHLLVAMLELGQPGEERKWGSPLVDMLRARRAGFEARLRASLEPPQPGVA